MISFFDRAGQKVKRESRMVIFEKKSRRTDQRRVPDLEVKSQTGTDNTISPNISLGIAEEEVEEIAAVEEVVVEAQADFDKLVVYLPKPPKYKLTLPVGGRSAEFWEIWRTM